MTSGLVIVDKPPDWTSHDVVGRLRRLAGTRKVGHAGTLDPMATGVLVLGINRATRLLGHLMLTEKEYVATIRLGASTVTDDKEGDVIAETSAAHLSDDEIRSAVEPFRGDIEQIPSAVSAIKVDGQRSYARVRAGEDVVLKSRPVHVETFEVNDIREVGEFRDVDIRVICSSGTYIRAFARDFGTAVGVGGHLTMLRRTRVGPFTLENAKTLDELGTEFGVLDLAVAARLTFPAFEASEKQANDIGFGRALAAVDLGAPGPVAVFAPDGEFLALYEAAGDDAKALAVFATVSP
ncbi:MAG: tRNA pseudouridine(55) synthase TruB [Kineosporiaceae bacterium]|nr:tRNA pseudouridine(55) synthase TruB [Aeromicrobium sp.]